MGINVERPSLLNKLSLTILRFLGNRCAIVLCLTIGCAKSRPTVDGVALHQLADSGNQALAADAPAPLTPSTVASSQPNVPTTAPAVAAETNLLAMGDWGEGVAAQKKVADTMADYVMHQHVPFAGLLSAGDNFYVRLASVDDPAWQNLFEKMYDPDRLDFPFYISLGNHDYDQKKYLVELAYAKLHPGSRWKEPDRWFRVDLPPAAPLVTVIILDSNHDDLSAVEWAAQIKFLESELAKPRAPWTICVAHHPFFSNGAAGDNGVLQRDWGMLFKKYNVDLYLCGHEHNLQHLEMPGWKTSFVLAGGGGAHKHPMIRDNRGPFSRSIYGFVHFDFTPQRLTVHYIDADGQEVHSFERSKAGDVKTLINGPSDPGIDKPLEAIQGLFDKLHPSTAPATQP